PLVRWIIFVPHNVPLAAFCPSASDTSPSKSEIVTPVSSLTSTVTMMVDPGVTLGTAGTAVHWARGGGAVGSYAGLGSRVKSRCSTRTGGGGAGGGGCPISQKAGLPGSRASGLTDSLQPTASSAVVRKPGSAAIALHLCMCHLLV